MARATTTRSKRTVTPVKMKKTATPLPAASKSKKLTPTSARKQAEQFSTPRGGAVGIRRSNVANAVNKGTLATSHSGERPIIEKRMMQEYIASKKPAKTASRKKGVRK